MGIFKSKKSKNIEKIGTAMANWYQFNMLLLKAGPGPEYMEKPRSKVGITLFYFGSIDLLCQHYGLDDTTSAKISIDLLEQMGYSPDITTPIYINFYTNPNKSDFALAANVKGGREFKSYLEGEAGHPVLPKLVTEWANDPDLTPSEVWLVK